MLAFLLFSVASATTFYEPPLTLPPKQKQYEFTLNINLGLTMGHLDRGNAESTAFLWNTTTGDLEERDNDVCSKVEAVANSKTYVTADGLHKRFIAVNDRLPGPPLVVWEGSEVVVHVINNLLAESVTVHYHGQFQNGTFWYDGAGNINQCPIRPGETFTYRFTAEPPGTYFYHGHFVSDRGDGLIGALVVLNDASNQTHVETSAGEEQIDKQFAMVLHDWYTTSTANEYMYAKYGLNQFRYGWEDLQKCYGETKTYDGSKLGELTFHAGLINGRGWHNANDLQNMPEKLPLGRYLVNSTDSVLFRVINAGTLYPFMFSVDGHTLTTIATDGNLIEQVDADYVTVFTGERVDLILKPKSKLTKNKFAIISHSTEMYQEDMSAIGEQHFTAAILEYADLPDAKLEMPKVSFPPSACTKTSPCVAVGCPFGKFAGKEDEITCKNLNTITHAKNQTSKALMSNYTEGFQEFFLNMFVDSNMGGLSFSYPKAPPALFPGEENLVTKTCEGCDRDGTCRCTQHLNLTKDAVVQIVLFNRGTQTTGIDGGDLDAFPHPIHFHGHHFYVVKIAYPSYNKTTGLMDSFNADIGCKGEKAEGCNVAGWADKGWSKGRVPGMNLLNPPLKDTIPVPVGGYVVLRFVADNPGYWIGHCHMLPHHLDGMAVLVKEGDIGDMPPRPENYPQCYQYRDGSSPTSSPPPSTTKQATAVSRSDIGAVLVAVIALVLY